MIGSFFREIDRADELGSGMRNLMLYGKNYGGADPQLIEGDIFQMVISAPEFGEVPADAPKQVSGKTSGKILDSIRRNSNITIPEIAEITGVTARSVERNIKKLQENGLLQRIGPAKGGHWEVVDPENP